MQNDAGWAQLDEVIAKRQSAASWDPPSVDLITKNEFGRRLLSCSMPWLSHDVLTFQSIPKDVKQMLDARGEFLPLRGDVRSYTVLNVLTFVDALDAEESDVLRFEESGRIYAIRKHVFRPHILEQAGVNIFRIPDLRRSSIYLTQELVTSFEDAGQTGTLFEEVWRDQ